MIEGQITNVIERNVGSVLESAVALGASSLTVAHPDRFGSAGTLRIEGTEVVEYTVDEDGNLDLASPTGAAYDVDTQVDVFPEQKERIAFFREQNAEEDFTARIPVKLWDRVPLGSREADEGEWIICERTGGDLYVYELVAHEPTVDPATLDLENATFFERLRTLLLVANRLYVAGEANEAEELTVTPRLEFTSEGIRLIGPDGTVMVTLLTSGEVMVRGRVQFGTASQLTSEDVIELMKFAGSGTPTYQTPAFVQSRTKEDFASSVSISFSSPTTNGNLALAVVTCYSNRTVNAPVGWTKIEEATGAGHRVAVFRRTAANSFTGPIEFALASGTSALAAQIFEFSGVDIADVEGQATGSGTTATVSATATQPGLALALFTHESSEGGDYATPDSDYALIRQNGAGIGAPAISARRNLAAAGLESVSAEMPFTQSLDWVAVLVLVKAKQAAAEPADPVAGAVRIFAREVAGLVQLYTLNAGGDDKLLGPRWTHHERLSADYTITGTGGTRQNIGLSEAIPRPGTYRVRVYAHVNYTSGTPGQTKIGITLDGVQQPGDAQAHHAQNRTTVSCEWDVTTTVAGQAIAVNAEKAAAGGVDIKATDTKLTIEQIS
jgi:hypothetical protein